MDDNRDNGRHKPDMFKAAAQTQWLMQHQPSMKQIMSIIAERDAAIQERNMAINEKNKALEERNLAVLERDAAIHQKNEALAERDNALAALQYRENHINGVGCLNNGGSSSSCPPSIVKQEEQNPHQLIHQHHQQHQLDYNSKIGFEPVLLREAAASVSAIPVTDNGKQSPKTKRGKDTKDGTGANKRASTTKKKVKREDDDGEQQGIDNNAPTALKSNWKGQDLGLNQVAFDDSTMPSPVCSCTGVYRQCYKWGNGGWQSACCTTTMSMYPLPAVLGKKHARIGGRKMSGGAFSKLLSRLAAEGQDLTNPVDLKEHWAKHGTNRYITIK